MVAAEYQKAHAKASSGFCHDLIYSLDKQEVSRISLEKKRPG
jgi:hypothetical protein